MVILSPEGSLSLTITEIDMHIVDLSGGVFCQGKLAAAAEGHALFTEGVGTHLAEAT
jgi:hypothetical protein